MVHLVGAVQQILCGGKARHIHTHPIAAADVVQVVAVGAEIQTRNADLAGGGGYGDLSYKIRVAKTGPAVPERPMDDLLEPYGAKEIAIPVGRINSRTTFTASAVRMNSESPATLRLFSAP